MSEPTVCVIIPTFNRGHLISRTVDCVLGQTYPHCHVIVVDDGSTDDTRDVIAARYGSQPRVRYIYQTNRGVSAARNAALAVADGTYIAFLDSDDVWRPWKLEVQVACMERLRSEGVGMLWGDMDLVDQEGNVLTANANRTSYSAYRLFPPEQAFAHVKRLSELAPEVQDPGKDTRVYWGDMYGPLAMGNMCPVPSVILTRERARAVGPYNESMRSGEDHDYHLRACECGPAAFLDIATFAYRKGADDQLTHKNYKLMIAQNALRTVEDALKRGGDRIRLTPQVIEKSLADLHAWLGSEFLDAGDHVGARRHLVLSLRHRPIQTYVWGRLAAASLPRALTERLRSSFRAAKRRAGGR